MPTLNIYSNHNRDYELFLAAEDGRLDEVEYLHTNGANVNALLAEGATALFFTVEFGHFNVVVYLVANGADVDLGQKDGATPLFFAARTGHLKVVQCLVDVAEKQRKIN